MTKSVGLLTEAILERDQPRTTDLFFRMVKREGQSLADALDVVTTAEAPFVQVPSHINVRDGQITLINNDHTILGLRTAASLAPYLPESHRMLPFLQGVWYIPAGLDIWNQLLGRYPGRYATMKGMNVPPPSYGPVVWHQEQPPIVQEGQLAERLHRHVLRRLGHTQPGQSGESIRDFAQCEEDGLLVLQPCLLPLRLGGAIGSQRAAGVEERPAQEAGDRPDRGASTRER